MSQIEVEQLFQAMKKADTRDDIIWVLEVALDTVKASMLSRYASKNVVETIDRAFETVDNLRRKG